MKNADHPALILGAAMLCLTGCDTGSTAKSGNEVPGSAGFTAVDASFISRAGRSVPEEITFAELARSKASNPAVRSFAVSLVADLARLNQQLSGLTQSKGLTPPSEMDQVHAMQLQQLQTLNGPAFDRAYLDGQLKELTTVVQVFQHEADIGSDPQVRSFAQQNVSMLFEHVHAASTIAGM